MFPNISCCIEPLSMSSNPLLLCHPRICRIYIVKILGVHNTVRHSFLPVLLFLLGRKDNLKITLNRVEMFESDLISMKQNSIHCNSGKWQGGDPSANLRHYVRDLKSNQLWWNQTQKILHYIYSASCLQTIKSLKYYLANLNYYVREFSNQLRLRQTQNTL